MQKKVVIVGAGIAGLTAATDLINKGYLVEIYETKPYPGGKAYGFHDERGYPVEHSGRVYGKYFSLYEYMKLIPYKNASVFDNLVPIETYLMLETSTGKVFNHIPDVTARGFKGYIGLIKLMRSFGVRYWDLFFLFIESVKYRFSSRYRDYLNTISFKQAMLDGWGQRFGDFMRQFLTILISAKPTATASSMYQELFLVMAAGLPLPKDCTATINLLNGPTSERFIDPWIEDLKNKGVVFHFNSPVTIQGNTIYQAQDKEVIADAYLFCVSLPVAKELFPQEVLPSVQSEQWTNGMQFYLKERPSFLPRDYSAGFIWNQPWRFGFFMYDNNTFWKNVVLPEGVKCVASISFNDALGNGKIFGKPITECAPEELIAETLAQCGIDKNLVIGYVIDPALHYEQGKWTESMSLFVVTPEDYPKLNDGKTQCKNRFLVGEFTKTFKEIPTMEKSCQAGQVGAQRVIEYLTSAYVKG
ncbi:MAG: oleate hydratase [Candidatus Dependentiae bacterium]|nr:oleate hydratase [Candidatus Dependentiae bacterium]